MITMEKVQKVLMLHIYQGKSFREIAILEDIHRDTVSKYVHLYEERRRKLLYTDKHLNEDLTKDLDARVNLSNGFGPTIFVSVHNNAASSTSANGVETLVPNAATSLTKNLASSVNAKVASSSGMNQRQTPVYESGVRVLGSANKCT